MARALAEAVRTSVPPIRADVLRDIAIQAARSWANEWIAALAAEGRPVAGGWPGTMSDARARAGALATRTLGTHAMSALDHDELRDLTHATYKEAQRCWRDRAPSAPVDDE